MPEANPHWEGWHKKTAGEAHASTGGHS
jgi:hypothetical protein